MTKPHLSILTEAALIHDNDRENVHGDPSANTSKIAAIWTAILGIPITGEQVCLCMAGLKLARLATNPNHRDSLVDLAGYARLFERVQEAGDATGELDPTHKVGTTYGTPLMSTEEVDRLYALHIGGRKPASPLPTISPETLADGINLHGLLHGVGQGRTRP